MIKDDALYATLNVYINVLGWNPDSTNTETTHAPIVDSVTGITTYEYTLSFFGNPDDILTAAATNSDSRIRRLASNSTFDADVAKATVAAMIAKAQLDSLFDEGTLLQELAASGLAQSLGYDTAQSLLAAMTAIPVQVTLPSTSNTLTPTRSSTRSPTTSGTPSVTGTSSISPTAAITPFSAADTIVVKFSLVISGLNTSVILGTPAVAVALRLAFASLTNVYLVNVQYVSSILVATGVATFYTANDVVNAGVGRRRLDTNPTTPTGALPDFILQIELLVQSTSASDRFTQSSIIVDFLKHLFLNPKDLASSLQPVFTILNANPAYANIPYTIVGDVLSITSESRGGVPTPSPGTTAIISSSSTLPLNALIGIVIGALVFLTGTVAVARHLYFKSQRRQQECNVRRFGLFSMCWRTNRAATADSEDEKTDLSPSVEKITIAESTVAAVAVVQSAPSLNLFNGYASTGRGKVRGMSNIAVSAVQTKAARVRNNFSVRFNAKLLSGQEILSSEVDQTWRAAATAARERDSHMLHRRIVSYARKESLRRNGPLRRRTVIAASRFHMYTPPGSDSDDVALVPSSSSSTGSDKLLSKVCKALTGSTSAALQINFNIGVVAPERRVSISKQVLKRVAKLKGSRVIAKLASRLIVQRAVTFTARCAQISPQSFYFYKRDTLRITETFLKSSFNSQIFRQSVILAAHTKKTSSVALLLPSVSMWETIPLFSIAALKNVAKDAVAAIRRKREGKGQGEATATTNTSMTTLKSDANMTTPSRRKLLISEVTSSRNPFSSSPTRQNPDDIGVEVLLLEQLPPTPSSTHPTPATMILLTGSPTATALSFIRDGEDGLPSTPPPTIATTSTSIAIAVNPLFRQESISTFSFPEPPSTSQTLSVSSQFIPRRIVAFADDADNGDNTSLIPSRLRTSAWDESTTQLPLTTTTTTTTKTTATTTATETETLVPIRERDVGLEEVISVMTLEALSSNCFNVSAGMTNVSTTADVPAPISVLAPSAMSMTATMTPPTLSLTLPVPPLSLTLPFPPLRTGSGVSVPKKFEIESAAARLARFRAAANATVSKTRTLAAWATTHDNNDTAVEGKASSSIPRSRTGSVSKNGSNTIDSHDAAQQVPPPPPPPLQIPGTLLSGSRSQPAFLHNLMRTKSATNSVNSSPLAVSPSSQQAESPLLGAVSSSPKFPPHNTTASTTHGIGAANSLLLTSSMRTFNNNITVPNAAFTSSRAIFNANSAAAVSRPLGTAPGGRPLGTTPGGSVVSRSIPPPPILPRSRRRDE